MTSLANRRSAILLFSFPDCLHSHRTRLVIKEKEIVAELHEVDINNIDEEIKFISPYNDFPTLVDRELILQNSRVIIEYLDERFPHPPLLPVDPVARAKFRLALYRIEHQWYPEFNIQCARALKYGYDYFDNNILGDINSDDQINVLDVIIVVNLILENSFNELGDMNEDGILNILDIIDLINLILD